MKVRGTMIGLGVLLSFVLSACPKKVPHGYKEPPEDGVTITCPVTGTQCEKLPTTPSAVFAAKTYYFCDEAAHARFVESPERFADPAKMPGKP